MHGLVIYQEYIKGLEACIVGYEVKRESKGIQGMQEVTRDLRDILYLDEILKGVGGESVFVGDRSFLVEEVKIPGDYGDFVVVQGMESIIDLEDVYDIENSIIGDTKELLKDSDVSYEALGLEALEFEKDGNILDNIVAGEGKEALFEIFNQMQQMGKVEGAIKKEEEYQELERIKEDLREKRERAEQEELERVEQEDREEKEQEELERVEQEEREEKEQEQRERVEQEERERVEQEEIEQVEQEETEGIEPPEDPLRGLEDEGIVEYGTEGKEDLELEIGVGEEQDIRGKVTLDKNIDLFEGFEIYEEEEEQEEQEEEQEEDEEEEQEEELEFVSGYREDIDMDYSEEDFIEDVYAEEEDILDYKEGIEESIDFFLQEVETPGMGVKEGKLMDIDGVTAIDEALIRMLLGVTETIPKGLGVIKRILRSMSVEEELEITEGDEDSYV